MSINAPPVGSLYVKMTEPTTSSSSNSVNLPGALDMLGKLSLTSQFKVCLHLGRFDTGNEPESRNLLTHLTSTGILDNPVDVVSYDFFCSDASLPGVSLNSVQEAGSRQGIIENFPINRVYPPFEITFYVDNEFKIIRLFEEWINYISPLYTGNGSRPFPVDRKKTGTYDRPDYFRLRYPDTYKRIISITKFERNFRVGTTNKITSPDTITYRMIDAYPDNINSIPVTYEGSIITKTTVRFLYSRYAIDVNKTNKSQNELRSLIGI